MELDWLKKIIEKRDMDAFSMLYDAYAPVAYRVCVLVLKDEQEAQDTVQEIFSKFWERPQAYDPARGRLHTWFSLVARSRAIDRLRQRRRQLKRVTLSAEGSLDHLDGGPGASGMASPHEEAEQAQRRQRVLKLLQALPKPQAEVLTLSFYRGLSQAEMASSLKLPLGTVKTRMRLALAKLAEQAGPELKDWL